jgi:quercetin dioxygenase-like cupin family protein
MSVKFDPAAHILNLHDCPIEEVSDGCGGAIVGVHGLSGAQAKLSNGKEVGVDSIAMQPGSAFELHVHPGAHILVVTAGAGAITVDGIDHAIREGDSVFVPANYPHGVKAGASTGVSFLAFGYPHRAVSAPDRMRLFEQPPA